MSREGENANHTGDDHELTRLTVEIQDDFLKRQTSAKPIKALSELIWNALDGDATRVTVEIVREDLAGGMSRIVVGDNGTGFSHDDAEKLFRNLGGSWKRTTRRTSQRGRMVHGIEGRGRYKALALGRAATWRVCHEANGLQSAFTISMLEDDIKGVRISRAAIADDRPTGVIVEIDDLHREFRSLGSDEGRQELTELFAFYILDYPDVTIRIDGTDLNPEEAIAGQAPLPIDPIIDDDGTTHSVELQVIEWRSGSRKTLYLCSEDGFPLDEVSTRFHVGGYAFSAYLKSTYIETLHRADRLGFGEMDAQLRPAIENARQAIKDYFRERDAERARSVVEEWKEEKVYPYKGEPASPIEAAERQVFDIVAVNLQSYSQDLESAPPKSRALHLRMLKYAIERSPEELQMILSEVMQLPARKQKELADLLQETSLVAIITAAKTVADRLKFITALEAIVFDPEKRERLKERSQLHKILAKNTWVFGEEYHLWVSDGDLRRVLQKHRAHLDPTVVINDPVTVVGQKHGIVDLMFSAATRRHRSDDIEHMVVELKAPKVLLGADDTTQIKKYALAVSQDERFATVSGLRWHFWLVGNRYNDMIAADIDGGPDPSRRLLQRRGNVQIGVKTWGELIEENRARLQFFQEHLEHNADESQALRYLKDRHAEFLSGVIDEYESNDR